MVVEQNSIEMADTEVCALNFIHFVLVIGLKHGFFVIFSESNAPNLADSARDKVIETTEYYLFYNIAITKIHG